MRKSSVLFLILVVSALNPLATAGEKPFYRDADAYRTAEIFNVVPDESSPRSFILLLRTAGEDDIVFLPIWIGEAEARAIMLKALDKRTPRPMTHDLLLSIIKVLRADVVEILVDSLEEKTFLGRVVLRSDGDIYPIDARPSDSVALALRAGAPIRISKELLEQQGITEKKIRERKGGKKKEPVEPAPKEGKPKGL